MITFLRKIRRSFINSGKTQKYLLYACGEIALVVIGILIALQINSWKTEYENRKLENYFYGRILSDIEATSQDIQDAINSANSRAEYGIGLLNILGLSNSYLNNLNLDSVNENEFLKMLPPNISDVSSKLFSLKFVNIMDIRTAGFSEITSSGKLSILRDEKIRSEIAEYYQQMDDWAESNTFFRGSGERYLQHLENAGIGIADLDDESVITAKVKRSEPLIAAIKSTISLAQEQSLSYKRMKIYVDEFADKIRKIQK